MAERRNGKGKMAERLDLLKDILVQSFDNYSDSHYFINLEIIA